MSQLTSNQLDNELSVEQPEPSPIPNGYGTIKLPHLLLHPGLVMAPALSSLLVLSLSNVAAGVSSITSMIKKIDFILFYKCVILAGRECITEIEKPQGLEIECM